jgi:hypothetical protein
MSNQQCPFCFTEMKTIPVAPCWDCGHELKELLDGEHTYAEFKAFEKEPIVLCDFCDVDFGSYHPEYFGFKSTERLNIINALELVKGIIEPISGVDLYCSECQHRLKFIKFRMAILDMNE